MNSFNKSNLQNIKHIFEEKTGTPLETSRTRTVRPVKRVLLAAAAVMCLLTMTCYAVAATPGVGDYFKSFFGVYQGNPLSVGQNEYIDDRTAVIGESVTQDEVTVTVTGAITDGTIAYIMVDIVAPEDKNIESLPLGFDTAFEKLKLEGQENESISSISTSCQPLADRDGKENTVSMIIKYHVYKFNGSNFTLADGRNRTLVLTDLFYHENTYPYSLCTVAEGTWKYDLAFTAVNDKEVELLSAPISGSYSQISGNQVEATIFSVKMKGLSTTVYYTLDPKEVQEAGDFGVLRFIMKDGSVINAYPEKAGQTNLIENGELIPNTFSHYCAYEFEAPINYEDLAALYIGETAIDIDLQ